MYVDLQRPLKPQLERKPEFIFVGRLCYDNEESRVTRIEDVIQVLEGINYDALRFDGLICLTS